MKGSLKQVFSVMLVTVTMVGITHSQVIIIPEVQANGIVIKKQVWSMVINNLSGSAKQASLYVSITDRSNSQVLLEANSGIVSIQPGVKRLTYQDLAPLNYSVASAGFSDMRQLNQPLPVGEYLICYKLFATEPASKDLILASECSKVIAEPLSPPQLIQPDNRSNVPDPRPVLTWTPPAPVYMFSSLSYDIVVSPLYEKQSPEEALQRNLPVMTINAANNSLGYPSSFTALEAGKTYAWQVVAKDAGRFSGKSDVWTFTIIPDSIKRIIDNASFIKIQEQESEIVDLQQGVLKIDYINRSRDSVVSAIIEDMTELNTKPIRFTIIVKQGQNMIQRDINKLGRLNGDHVYKITIKNKKGEAAFFRFVPKYYL